MMPVPFVLLHLWNNHLKSTFLAGKRAGLCFLWSEGLMEHRLVVDLKEAGQC